MWFRYIVSFISGGTECFCVCARYCFRTTERCLVNKRRVLHLSCSLYCKSTVMETWKEFGCSAKSVVLLVLLLLLLCCNAELQLPTSSGCHAQKQTNKKKKLKQKWSHGLQTKPDVRVIRRQRKLWPTPEFICGFLFACTGMFSICIWVHRSGVRKKRKHKHWSTWYFIF